MLRKLFMFLGFQARKRRTFKKVTLLRQFPLIKLGQKQKIRKLITKCLLNIIVSENAQNLLYFSFLCLC